MTYLRETYQPGPPPSGADPPVASPWPVTIAVLTRDEQRCVRRCLDSVLACPVDAVVVVDTGSTDLTLELVEAYRDSRIEVVRHRWDDSFANARNLAIQRARPGWIVFVDADEWLTDETAATLRACLSELEPLAGRSPTTLAPVICEDGSTERYEDIPRIMPTWALRFHGPVHEYPRVPDRDVVPGLLGVSLEFRHDGYGPEVARVKDKRTRNLALVEQARRDEPDNPRWLFYQLRDGLWDIPGDEVADLCDRLLRADHPGPGDRNHASTYRRAGLAQACSRLGQLGEWRRVLRYCTDLDKQSPPANPDAVYFRGLHELHAGAGANPQGLLAAVRIRKNTAAVAKSGLDTEGRHLDALIAGYLRDLKGKEAANSYLELCRPWTDPFFDASRLRR